MTQEKIPLVAVLGSPVAHSKSPLLHGFWLKQFGIQGHYVPIDVMAADLEQVLQTLPKMGFVGANVTLPHKEKILSIADQISDRAALIGAANTLVFQPDGKLYADNTDGYGFIENIRQHAPDWQAKDGPALVLGAGGAARAIVSALLEAGAPEVRISNRTRARAAPARGGCPRGSHSGENSSRRRRRPPGCAPPGGRARRGCRAARSRPRPLGARGAGRSPRRRPSP